MKTPGQILHAVAVKVKRVRYPWSEVHPYAKDQYEEVARLFLARMNKSNAAAKPSKKV